MSSLKLGKYLHYKGKYYLVIGVSKHSETLEKLVTYICLYDNPRGQMWVRPLSMFQETVKLPGGKTVKRFEYVEK